MKTIAHPVATSYANTYKVAASYPTYAHAPVAAYHASYAGKTESSKDLIPVK